MCIPLTTHFRSINVCVKEGYSLLPKFIQPIGVDVRLRDCKIILKGFGKLSIKFHVVEVKLGKIFPLLHRWSKSPNSTQYLLPDTMQVKTALLAQLSSHPTHSWNQLSQI